MRRGEKDEQVYQSAGAEAAEAPAMLQRQRKRWSSPLRTWSPFCAANPASGRHLRARSSPTPATFGKHLSNATRYSGVSAAPISRRSTSARWSSKISCSCRFPVGP